MNLKNIGMEYQYSLNVMVKILTKEATGREVTHFNRKVENYILRKELLMFLLIQLIYSVPTQL